jgi:hypothetical protein
MSQFFPKIEKVLKELTEDPELKFLDINVVLDIINFQKKRIAKGALEERVLKETLEQIYSYTVHLRNNP